MKVEKIDAVGVNVKDLDKAVKLFSAILGTTFVDLEERKTQISVKDPQYQATWHKKPKLAIDRTGFLELIQPDPAPEKEGFRDIHFKVDDIEQAKSRMAELGIKLVAEVKAPAFREVIYEDEDLHGIRLAFLEYTAPTLVDALLVQ